MKKRIRMILECPFCKRVCDKYLTREQVDFLIYKNLEIKCYYCNKEVKMTLLTDNSIKQPECKTCW